VINAMNLPERKIGRTQSIGSSKKIFSTKQTRSEIDIIVLVQRET
jgi:hypothetical protein